MTHDQNTDPLAVSPRYVRPAESAKLLRIALKRAFPDVKFGVRTSTYSGGASIQVTWTDGPFSKDVDAICRGFKGSGFDGSIDLKYSNHAWLAPDGTATIAHSYGSTGSGGCDRPVLTDPPAPGCELVSFMADYIFTTRRISLPIYWAFVFAVENARAVAVRHAHPVDEFGRNHAVQMAMGNGTEPKDATLCEFGRLGHGVYESDDPLAPAMTDIEREARTAYGWTPFAPFAAPVPVDAFAADLAAMVATIEAA